MARSKSQPALVGNLSASKKAIVGKDGVYILHGSDWRYLTWREVDALLAMRTEFQQSRALDLDMPAGSAT
jgi:hypothetical protein